jgi:hypothetical protein
METNAFTVVAEQRNSGSGLNSTEAKELSGTDDASFPFWSPDSFPWVFL